MKKIFKNKPLTQELGETLPHGTLLWYDSPRNGGTYLIGRLNITDDGHRDFIYREPPYTNRWPICPMFSETRWDKYWLATPEEYVLWKLEH